MGRGAGREERAIIHTSQPLLGISHTSLLSPPAQRPGILALVSDRRDQESPATTGATAPRWGTPLCPPAAGPASCQPGCTLSFKWEPRPAGSASGQGTAQPVGQSPGEAASLPRRPSLPQPALRASQSPPDAQEHGILKAWALSLPPP